MILALFLSFNQYKKNSIPAPVLPYCYVIM